MCGICMCVQVCLLMKTWVEAGSGCQVSSLSTILFYLDVCIYEYVYAYVYIPVHCLLSLATLLP